MLEKDLKIKISTNFDRTGFHMDGNLIFPIDRLNELTENGFIGSVANYHYSFMGATDPLITRGELDFLEMKKT